MSQWQGPNFPFHHAAQGGYTFAYLRVTVRTKTDPCYAANRARSARSRSFTGSTRPQIVRHRSSKSPSRRPLWSCPVSFYTINIFW